MRVETRDASPPFIDAHRSAQDPPLGGRLIRRFGPGTDRFRVWHAPRCAPEEGAHRGTLVQGVIRPTSLERQDDVKRSSSVS
jgi:hypothetical protein